MKTLRTFFGDRPWLLVVLAFAVTIGAIAQWVYRTAPPRQIQIPQAMGAAPTGPIDPVEVERCKVPEFAKALGHEEKWKLHNNCK